MSGRENILARIDELLEQGSLAQSMCSAALTAALRPLVEAGVIVSERAGAGRRLVVRNLSALMDFKRREFPDTMTAGLGARVSGVGRFRDSKSLAGDTPEIVSVRAWNDAAMTVNGAPVGTAEATARYGVFSFLLDGHQKYALRGVCALVENPAVFMHFEHLGLRVDLVIYGHGRLSTRVLNWLGRAGESHSVLHLPDYDPAGLSEHLRLRGVLGNRARLHLPVDLADRFERFSNRGLLYKGNSQAMLAQLRRSELPEVRRVVKLIDQHNAGLEQEALLLAFTP